MKSKRNEPCSCGSGKKYKKCCLKNETSLSGTDILRVLRQLFPKLESAGREHYGDSVLDAAWKDFSRWGLEAIAREEQAYQSAFDVWYLFSWLPDDTTLSGQSFDSPLSDQSIAVDYLQAHKEELSPVEQDLIELASTAPYSFYSVRAVTHGQRLHLREIYTKKEVVVTVEPGTYCAGDLLFTSVISIEGVSVLLGCMPQVLSANEQMAVQAHREKWKAEEGRQIDRRLLYLHDTELRRFYFMLLSKAQKAALH